MEGFLLNGESLQFQNKLKAYIRTNTDEFGGYSKPKWHPTDDQEEKKGTEEECFGTF